VPALAMDVDNPEDIDTEQEDHCYDEAAHIVMARAYGLKESEIAAKVAAKVREAERATLPPSNQQVWGELDKIREDLEQEQ
jgi:hypothetical protein